MLALPTRSLQHIASNCRHHTHAHLFAHSYTKVMNHPHSIHNCFINHMKHVSPLSPRVWQQTAGVLVCSMVCFCLFLSNPLLVLKINFLQAFLVFPPTVASNCITQTELFWQRKSSIAITIVTLPLLLFQFWNDCKSDTQNADPIPNTSLSAQLPLATCKTQTWL